MAGKRAARMADVAARAGVTKMTVSRALRSPDLVHAETRARIAAAIDATNFIPNRVAGALKAGHSRIVAAVVPSLAGAVLGRSLQGLSDTLTAQGYELLVGYSDFSLAREEDLVRALLGWRPAGLMLTGHTHSPATREILEEASVPVVEFMEYRARPFDMCVGYSQAAAARAMVAHLHARGRRKIGFCHISPRGNERARSRWRGYREGVRALGLPDDPSLAVETPMSLEGGALAVRELTARHRDLDALFFGTDMLAIGGLHECQRRGIAVPGDIAIASYDGSDLVADLVPSLTSLNTPGHEVGVRAAEMLLGRLAGTKVGPRAVDVGFKIIQREST